MERGGWHRFYREIREKDANVRFPHWILDTRGNLILIIIAVLVNVPPGRSLARLASSGSLRNCAFAIVTLLFTVKMRRAGENVGKLLGFIIQLNTHTASSMVKGLRSPICEGIPAKVICRFVKIWLLESAMKSIVPTQKLQF